MQTGRFKLIWYLSFKAVVSREQGLSVKGLTRVRALVPQHEPDKLSRSWDPSQRNLQEGGGEAVLLVVETRSYRNWDLEKPGEAEKPTWPGQFWAQREKGALACEICLLPRACTVYTHRNAWQGVKVLISQGETNVLEDFVGLGISTLSWVRRYLL